MQPDSLGAMVSGLASLLPNADNKAYAMNVEVKNPIQSTMASASTPALHSETIIVKLCLKVFNFVFLCACMHMSLHTCMYP